jgi:ribonuclease P protein component
MKEKGFSKQERICRRNDFNLLFSSGKSFFSYPFRCIFCTKESDELLVRIAVSVSKKKFKRAADRNRIKRLIRESYRLEKQELYTFLPQQPQTYDLLIIYTENKILDYKQFRNGMRGGMKKMMEMNKKLVMS